MMIRSVAAFIILLALISMALSAPTTVTSANTQERKRSTSENIAEGEAEMMELAERREEFFFTQRAFPFKEIPVDWRLKAFEHMRTKMANRLTPQLAAMLRPIGPASIANGQTFGSRQNVSGRVTSLAIDPQNPSVIYLGAAQGGLWRSTNNGQTWQPMTDNAPTQATGAVVIDPTNSSIIYIGTGEGNSSSDSFFGMGILKSTDGGRSWTNLAAQTFLGRSFNRLIIDPNNPRTLYAAIGAGFAGRARATSPRLVPVGIYKSTDGGVSWSISLQVNPPAPMPALGTTAYDIEIDIKNSSVLYAALDGLGIYKTTDGGLNWFKLTNGLPNNGFTRADIGIGKSNSNVLYISYGNIPSSNPFSRDLLGIFKSTNGGDTWNMTARPPGGFLCQCTYDNFIEPDPNNPEIVYFGGVPIFKSVNGGQSWTNITQGSGGTGLHVDFHAIAFAPDNSNQIFVGNDGGVWSSGDGGNTWINRNSTLNITQFQSVAIHPTDPNITIGGTQDNGTNLYVGNDTWQHADDGDGGFAAIDQSSPNVMYHTYFNFPGIGIGPARSEQGGRLGSWDDAFSGINQNDDVLFYAPFILDPNNQSTLYFGTNRLYRSMDRARTWKPISGSLTAGAPRAAISAIAVAPGAPRFIYTGSSDGAVFASQDGGESFQNVTDNLPTRYITDVVVDPNLPTTVYVSLNGFSTGHIFKSTSGGRSWQNISGNLPDVPAPALAINPFNPNNLFLGTDLGLFQTADGGISWTLVAGMPTVTVFDIAINGNLALLRLATHGRGIYELKLPKDSMPPQVTVNAPKGGENLTATSQFTINWTTSDDFGVKQHNITLSTDGGSSFPITIATGLAATAQNFLWTVPNIETNQARIRVSAIDNSNNEGFGVSDNNFTIAQGDFIISLAPAIQTVKAGTSASFMLDLKSNNGFAQSVNLTAMVTPADSSLTTSLSANSITAGNQVTLTVNTLASTPAKTFTITIVGTGGQLARTSTATATLNVTVPDFSLGFDAAQIDVSRGKKGQLTVNVNRTNGFADNVTVSAPDTKAIKVILTPPTQSTTATKVTFDFKVKKRAPRGPQQLTFTGQDTTGRVRTATLTLNIK
ncbi:MAG: hypothetical protein AB1489_13320 [Acidobacteriota bacterium]